MAKEVVVTHEGYKKLEEELDTLKTVKRSEIAEKIKLPVVTVTFLRTRNTMPPRKSRQWLKPALLTWKLP